LTPALLADALGALSGLDFACSAAVSADAIRVDWSLNSSLIAGLAGRSPNEGYSFATAETLAWFMLDSLARTLQANFPARQVYFTMLGGNPLIIPDSIWKFEPNDPYKGSLYCLAEKEGGAAAGGGGGTGAGEANRYIDRLNNLTLRYPSVFSLDGRVNPVSGRMEFPSREDGAVLSFWLEDNETGETLQDFIRNLDPNAKIRWAYDNPAANVLMLAETTTDAGGQLRGRAYQIVIQSERIIYICVTCEPERLDYWYDRMDVEFAVTE
jgi:hypothetical protein